MGDWKDGGDETTKVYDVAEAVPLERTKPLIIVLAGSNVGEMFEVNGDEIIGRAKGNAIHVVDDGVSREHARIVRDGDDLCVEDMGSRNGTYLNGKRTKRRVLSDGDKIQVGRTTILKFTLHDKVDDSFQQHMYDSALRDGLTQAFNKRYFVDRMHSEFQFAHRHSVPLSLVLIDLDKFKEINDTYGHMAGDHVLTEFADAVHQSMRNEDVLCRYGGDEFAVICRSIPIDGTITFANRLLKTIRELEIVYGDHFIPLTVSIGVSAIPDASVDSADDLLGTADRALYWAKEQGRNRVMVYETDVPEEDTRPT